jgi:hypothetical protein
MATITVGVGVNPYKAVMELTVLIPPLLVAFAHLFALPMDQSCIVLPKSRAGFFDEAFAKLF